MTQAQTLHKADTAVVPGIIRDLPPEAAQELLHELQVHQIELDLQNEELRRANDALEASRARYVNLYDQAPVGCCNVTEAGLITQANLALATMLGVARSKLAGQPLSRFMVQGDQDVFYLMRKRLLAQAGPQSCELRLVKPDGQAFWTKLQATTATGEDGEAQIEIAVSDITERRQAQEQLLGTAKFRDAILDSIPSQIAVLGRDGTILAINQTWRQFALDNSPVPGVPANNTQVGANYLAVCQAAIEADADPNAAAALHGILSVISGSASKFVIEYPCHSPVQQRWFSMAVTPLAVDHHAVVVTHTDITERVIARQLLERSHAELARALDLLERTGCMAKIGGWELDLATMEVTYSRETARIHEVDYPYLPPKLSQGNEYYPPEAWPIVRAAVQAAIEHGTAYDLEVPFITAKGRYLWVHIQGFAVQENGKTVKLHGTFQDNSERRQLQIQQSIHGAALKAISQGVVITGPDFLVISVNAAMVAITGYGEAEFIGRNCRFLQGADTDASTAAAIRVALRQGAEFAGEILNYRQDGTPFWNELAISPVIDGQGRLTHFVGVTRDISERKDAEAERRAVQERQSLTAERLVELSRRLVQAQEHARRQLARELHELTSPNLAALRINLAVLAKVAPAQHVEQEFFDRVADTRALIDDTTSSIRDICAELHATVLEGGGMVGVVQNYAQQFAKRTGLQVTVHCTHSEVHLAPKLALPLFRIVQEALTNCAKHAQAQRIDITLDLVSPYMQMVVQDDGIGFDLGQAPRAHSGLGLMNMRETAEFIGARLSLSSRVGAGTTVSVAITSPAQESVA
jgi:PAS domain S-box-containing protein